MTGGGAKERRRTFARFGEDGGGGLLRGPRRGRLRRFRDLQAVAGGSAAVPAGTDAAAGERDDPDRGDAGIFEAAGGTPPYTFDLVDLADPSGTLTPQEGGTSVLYTAPADPASDRLRVTDNLGAWVEADIVVEAAPVIPPLEVLTDQTDPPSAVASVAVPVNGTLTFSAAGGTPQYTFALIDLVDPSGTLTPPLENVASVLYTAPAEPGTDQLRVSDGSDPPQEVTVPITIYGPLVIVPDPVPTLAPGATFDFDAEGGVGSYTFSLGAPQAGGIDPDTGIYTAPDSPGQDQVTVTDSLGNTATVQVTIEEPVGEPG